MSNYRATRFLEMWGNARGEGKVTETFTRKVSRTLEGREVTCNGSEDGPALLIGQENGDEVLKLTSDRRGLKVDKARTRECIV